jgi:glycosyltransferase involved in cell wall biosynthesis
MSLPRTYLTAGCDMACGMRSKSEARLGPNATLLGYDLDLPSYRYRMRSLVTALEAGGWSVDLEQLPSGRYGLRTWERRALLRRSDVVVLHQIKLSAAEAWLFASLSNHRVFDFDDAIYVRKPRRLGEPAGDSRWRRKKFAATCRSVDVVAAGNDILAGIARPLARRVVTLPTALDVSAYRATTATQDDPPTVVWVGSPENLVYLELMRPAMARLAQRYPGLRLRVICSRFPDWPEVEIQPIVWSPSSEIDALAGAHIGVMPLTDDEWSRGKCAFKLLQYMAASLPCVASPVGANTEAVLEGKTGFYARSAVEWEQTLERLIRSAELRSRFGAAGRAHVESRYSMLVYQTRYLELFNSLLAGVAHPSESR